MKLRTDGELSLLTKDNILQELSHINELATDDFGQDNLFLLKKLKHFERTGHLMMWHDGSTSSSHSNILMMVSIMYDRAVFLTNEEYEQKYLFLLTFSQLSKNHKYICLHVAHQMINKFSLLRNAFKTYST